MNTTSKVWFTVADGVLSDTYWPTIDATNVHTLQYVVSDGHGFTDLQTRDMTYARRARSDRYGLHDRRLQQLAPLQDRHDLPRRSRAQRGADARALHEPSRRPPVRRLDPLAGGTGGGGSQNAGGNTRVAGRSGGQTVPVDSNTNTTTDAVNRNYAVPTYMALESSNRLLRRQRRIRRHRQ